jgi:phosphatidyl-myo-inositol dimannoside synthase
MRLQLFSSEFPPGPGGIGTHAFEVARQLQRLGWEIRVLAVQSYAPEQEIESFARALPFPVTRLSRTTLPPLKAVLRFWALTRSVRGWRPSVILATGNRCVWLASMFRVMSRVPLVAVGHGTEFGLKSSWERTLTRWAFGRADGVVAVSRYTLSKMHELGARPQSERVINNGADEEAFAPGGESEGFRQRHGLGKLPLLLSVGNVTARKGHDTVIRALSEILRVVPGVQYVVIGLPTLRARMEALATQLGVAERVHFLGRVDQETLAAAYNACDVFLMPSRNTPDGDFEGFGIAAVEAALCGKPSIVSAGSGLAEAVQDGVTGICIPEDDAAAMAAAVIRLLLAPELRTHMGEAARQRALTEQTWSVRAREYDEFLRAIVMSTGQGSSSSSLVTGSPLESEPK